MAVSVAGSLGARAIRDARNVAVVVSVKTPEFAKRKVLAVRHLNTLTRTRLLDDLAVVELTESALGIMDVARVAADEVAGISVAFLVCGSLATPTELRAASTKFPPGVEVVAISYLEVTGSPAPSMPARYAVRVRCARTSLVASTVRSCWSVTPPVTSTRSPVRGSPSGC